MNQKRKLPFLVININIVINTLNSTKMNLQLSGAQKN